MTTLLLFSRTNLQRHIDHPERVVDHRPAHFDARPGLRLHVPLPEVQTVAANQQLPDPRTCERQHTDTRRRHGALTCTSCTL